MGGAARRLAGCGPARRSAVRPAPVSWPGSAGRFLPDRVLNSLLRNLTGDAWVQSLIPRPPTSGTGTSPLYFSSRPPQASERVPPVVNCSRRPHSSDASSVPTRLTRSSRRLCVLFDVPLLPTRASPSPRSRPGHQERPRPSWCPVSSIPPSHHPQYAVLSSAPSL